ncbi:MAG TPA: 2-oxo-4-hydroxy-4-carboxy-5-ureidoimidazoline decarboxylase [Thermoanaerobaculia bacterium]|nr:2-oxo-4-hydroxy-4-carboxy-5-ureidoimidazoline decarboxylase [Thermoanaerobaculia bacterium]
MDLAAFNALPDDEARAALAACCGSSRWAAATAARRPFADLAALEAAADAVWWSLDPADWREALAAHPRIGERPAGAGRAARWSSGEQARVAVESDAAVRDELARANREYEERFGHLYVICASGRGPQEILADLRARLGNDPDTELRRAAAEQAAITRLRLRRLVGEPAPASGT